MASTARLALEDFELRLLWSRFLLCGRDATRALFISSCLCAVVSMVLSGIEWGVC